MDKKGLGALGLAVIAVLALGGFGFVPVLSHNIAVQHNEPIDGEVISTDIAVTEDDEGDKSYNPVVTYEYEVDGETYTNENTFPGGTTRKSGSRGWAENVIGNHPEGSETTIYYRPEDPTKAYLTNSDGWPDSWWLGVAGIGIGVLAGAWLVWLGFKRWRQRNLMKNTPTESVQALSIGPSEIKGTAVTENRDPLPAPFTSEECVLAKYEVKEYDDDDDDSGGSWKTVEEDTVFNPFHVDDGTGSVLIKPHEETTYELDPEDWTETYVDSSARGPDRIQNFVRQHPDLGFPDDRSGKDNDRKYRQNLIRDGESVYIFGTTQTREVESGYGASNEDRLVVKKVEDDGMREPMYLISDDEEEDLVGRRRFALWRLPVGVVFFGAAFFMSIGMFGPEIGLTIPAWF
jgi:hypothetical protein